MVQTFTDGALCEALTRASGAFQAPVQRLGGDDWLAAAEDWALGLGIRQVLALEAPIGPWRDRLDGLERRLADRDIRLARVRRPWDRTLWPLARRGYFPFREQALATTGPTPLLWDLLTPEQGPHR
jgi:deoxyribodipyrimidine photo-lyase